MKISGKTKLFGLFADPAEHSKSPIIYNKAFEVLGLDNAYLAFKVPKCELEGAIGAMRALGMGGANISMPHKERIVEYLDYVSEEATLCGAVNTVINNNGILKGYNTDIYGITKAIRQMGLGIEGVNAVILGLGGAGKAILTSLAINKANSVKVFVRGKNALDKGEEEAYRAKESVAFAEKLKNEKGVNIDVLDINDRDTLGKELLSAQLLINCTNIGMGEHEDESLISDSSFLHKDLKVMDIIYSPEKTRLLQQAEEAGCIYANGLDMLLFQAEEAFRLFADKELPLDLIREEINKL